MTSYIDEKSIWDPFTNTRIEIKSEKMKSVLDRLTIQFIHVYNDYDRIVVTSGGSDSAKPRTLLDLDIYEFSTGKLIYTKYSIHNRILMSTDPNPICPYISFLCDETFYCIDLIDGRMIYNYRNSFELSPSINIQHLAMPVTGYWPDLEYIDGRAGNYTASQPTLPALAGYQEHTNIHNFSGELLSVGYGRMIFYDIDHHNDRRNIKIWDFRSRL
jgi:hypothetical protein